MSSIDDIGFPKELLQNPARIRPSDEFLIGFERIHIRMVVVIELMKYRIHLYKLEIN